MAGSLVPVGYLQPESPKPKDGPLSMKFVPLPKGTTYLGWNLTKGSARKTEIKKDFEIAVYEVTQGQWQELMGNNPSSYSRGGDGKEKVKEIKDEDLKQFPVEQVSWNQVQEFIKKLNEKEAKGVTCTACRVRQNGNMLAGEGPLPSKNALFTSTSPNRRMTCRRGRRTATARIRSATQTRV